ncbi:DNA processing protein [Microbacterium sp. SORGH_AS 1204]|uniref:DNA-processing protein DprA n=1 Tax=Microbacterium sp. SORGH_AS_1204 TaxID=3041785 RepID=UPI00278CC64D|nr:DNA-processing protein DprA [Microbacterium sp. SORGH_AS_1204]MDQ1136897.1 DNA processing protein [Microbacterium sp. SORGH_AS_1204]
MIRLNSATAAVALRGLRGPDGAAAEEAYARAVWSVLVEPGDGVAGALVATHGAVDALRHALSSGDAELRSARSRWMPRLQPAAIEAALDAARRCEAALVVPGDSEWPTRLDDLGVHAPIALWRRGTTVPARGPAVALVGARASTAYGETVAADLAAELGGAGVAIVSGAAYGIDGACHRAALSVGASTVAFLAGGVDRPYPRGHENLLAQIAATGAVWSETPCGAAPTKWRFLSRNRLIAAMADAVVVVEAGWRSGSLNTAAHAATLGRALGAVPGPVTSAASAGCHRVLREFDGVCVTSSNDVLEMLGAGDMPPPAGEQAHTDTTTRLLDALSPRSARSTADVARRSGLAPDEAAILLGFAELEGRVTRDDAGEWRTVARDASGGRRAG